MTDEKHISATEADALRDGRLSAGELLRVVRHLETCAECGARMAQRYSASDAAARIGGALHAEITPRWHVARPDVKQYVRGRLDAADREVIESHVEDCPECASAVAARRSRDHATRTLFAAAAAVLVLIAIAAWWNIANRVVPVTRVQPPVASIGTTTVPPAPPVHRHDYGRADWNDLVASALHAGVVTLPDLTDVQPPRDTLRGPSTSHPAKLTPAGVVVESDRPRFSWPAVKGAKHYRVLVYANDREAAHGGPLTETSWQPDRPLKRGGIYEWQVICSMDDGTSTPMPVPPDPSPHFRVLSDDAAAELAAAQSAHPGDHLLLGVLAAHHGLADRAESELRTYSAAYPHEPLVRLNHQ